MMRRAALAFILSPLALAALAGCDAEPRPTYVDAAWVRLNANPQAPSAAYFMVNGGDTAVTLRGVTAEAAQRLEMHESRMEGGQMTMAKIDSVDIPANGKVEFKPGGKHVMLWGINPTVIEAGKMEFTFLFSNGDRIIVDAPIRKAGEDAPGAKEHEGH